MYLVVVLATVGEDELQVGLKVLLAAIPSKGSVLLKERGDATAVMKRSRRHRERGDGVQKCK
jgi:hypothetical protein